MPKTITVDTVGELVTYLQTLDPKTQLASYDDFGSFFSRGLGVSEHKLAKLLNEPTTAVPASDRLFAGNKGKPFKAIVIR